MKTKLTLYSLLTILLLGTSTMQSGSHANVENDIVKARMASMKIIAANMKNLSKVSRGRVSFDLNEVKEMLSIIEENAELTPQLFRDNVTEPASEAASEIWESFPDFTERALVLQTTANNLSFSIETIDDLPNAVKSLGGTCKSCHSKYRN